MLVSELANSQIRCILADEQKLKASTATELFVYEMPKNDSWRLRTNSDLGMNIENGLKDIQRNPGTKCMRYFSNYFYVFVISFRSDF